MSNSTKRAARTVLQVLIPIAIWVASAGPTVLDRLRENVNVPAWLGSTLAAVVGGAGVVTRVWLWAENKWPGLRVLIPISDEQPAVPTTDVEPPVSMDVSGDPTVKTKLQGGMEG